MIHPRLVDGKTLWGFLQRGPAMLVGHLCHRPALPVDASAWRRDRASRAFVNADLPMSAQTLPALFPDIIGGLGRCCSPKWCGKEPVSRRPQCFSAPRHGK